jgi:sulfatase maturation enzyme AslB (radical SAM superfamily)
MALLGKSAGRSGVTIVTECVQRIEPIVQNVAMSIDPLLDPFKDPRLAAERVETCDALQRPMHDLRISLLDRCNFRCPYCMPVSEYHEDYEFLTRPERLTVAHYRRRAAPRP